LSQRALLEAYLIGDKFRIPPIQAEDLKIYLRFLAQKAFAMAYQVRGKKYFTEFTDFAFSHASG
jgi:hypothetical protein